MKNICIVHWTDAAGLNDVQKEWLTIEESKEIAEVKWKVKNISCGFVIENNKNYIIIAGSYADPDIYSDMSMIPKILITKMVKIKR